MSFHTCVWMDHREAIILELTRESVESSRVRHHGPEQHLHRKADHVGHGSTGLDEGFMAELAGKLTTAKAILIVGPGEAKTGFKAWLEHKHPAIAANVWDVQSADHPTEGQLAAMARSYFHGQDKMH